MMTRSSRYWTGVYMLQWMLGALTVLVTFRVPDALPEMIGVLGLVTTTAYGIGGWVNRAERDPDFQRAVTAREAQAGSAA